MKTFLMRVLGLAYPSVYHALNKSSNACVRIAYDSYCVKGEQGLAEAVNHYLKTNFDLSSPAGRRGASDIRSRLLANSERLQYPCVIWPNEEGFETLPVSYDQSIAVGD